jgi:dTDP-glucose pyrophosphorylase
MTNENNFIDEQKTVKEALEQLNRVPEGMVLFVLDAGRRLVGTLTDGDIRRGLLAGKSIQEPVEAFMHHNFRFLRQHQFALQEVEELRRKGIQLVPLLDEAGQLIRLLNFRELRSVLPLAAVIMAGGRGERLKPHTNTTPKPLLKVGSKPILEHMLDRLALYGVQDITITVNYLGQQIRDYFGDGSSKGLQLRYLHEAAPLGTIGALSLLEEPAYPHLLLLNSDLLTNLDYEEFYNFHLEEGADVTVASIPYSVTVPYAILETEGHHRVRGLQEKPTYTYYANAGIYLIRSELLCYLPKGEAFNAPDFVELLLQKGYTVSAFPILGYWLDIGKPQDFARAQEDIGHVRF